MVFADDGYGSGVLGSIPATAFAVVVVGVGVEACPGVIGVAFGRFFGCRGFFFRRPFFDPGEFASFRLTRFPGLPAGSEDVRPVPRPSLRGASELAGALALLAQFGGFPRLLSLDRPTGVAAFAGSTARSHEEEGPDEKPDRDPSHLATIGTAEGLSKNA